MSVRLFHFTIVLTTVITNKQTVITNKQTKMSS